MVPLDVFKSIYPALASTVHTQPCLSCVKCMWFTYVYIGSAMLMLLHILASAWPVRRYSRVM